MMKSFPSNNLTTKLVMLLELARQNGANKIPDRNSKRHNGQDLKISISRCVCRRIQPRDASFWANFCGVFYSNDHEANYMQLHMVIAHVAAARGVSVPQINALLEQHITGRSLGLFGEPRVNVLALNLALQHAYPKP
jgi:K+-transporting ATPase, c chain